MTLIPSRSIFIHPGILSLPMLSRHGGSAVKWASSLCFSGVHGVKYVMLTFFRVLFFFQLLGQRTIKPNQVVGTSLAPISTRDDVDSATDAMKSTKGVLSTIDDVTGKY